MGIDRMTKAELIELIRENYNSPDERLLADAAALRDSIYGKRVFIRGLIEISNICENDCFYCGIRCSNTKLTRYRLDAETILATCRSGYEKGFRSFVLQGGEDAYFDDKILCKIISDILADCQGTAITLSLGERSKESYLRLRDAGASRYLLRHETANSEHYARLHPKDLTLENRKKCLYEIKDAGFQVGAGFMVASPFQTMEHLAEDILFLRDLQPHMVGLGPFIPQQDTPFGGNEPGKLEQTLCMLAITRLSLPSAMMPSTTALGSIVENGRIKGLLAGANVVMPNLSPVENRKDYALYDNKIATGVETAEGLSDLVDQLAEAGFVADFSRGDHISIGAAV